MHILILGCGWVGEEFGRAMLSKGASVTVTTTSIEKLQKLSEIGFQVHLANFDRDGTLDIAPKGIYDAVLNSVPASKRLSETDIRYRFLRVQKLLSEISYRKHIYLSSIGIYPALTGHYDETFDNPKQLHPSLKTAEDIMLSLADTKVFRLGGLFGKERILAKYFQEKICPNGGQPANSIHLDDVVELLQLGFEVDLQHTLYNVVAPEHPKKEDVIRRSAEKYGFRLPSSFDHTDSPQKIVLGNRLSDEFKYKFKFRSPLDF